MCEYHIMNLREKPQWKQKAAQWFHEKWNVPVDAYLESIEESLNSENPAPQWYLAVKEEQIITIALDDDTFVKYRDPDELSKYIRGKIVNSDMYYILIDEVQYAITKDELKNPENIKLYNVLNGLMRLRNVDI